MVVLGHVGEVGQEEVAELWEVGGDQLAIGLERYRYLGGSTMRLNSCSHFMNLLGDYDPRILATVFSCAIALMSLISWVVTRILSVLTTFFSI